MKQLYSAILFLGGFLTVISMDQFAITFVPWYLYFISLLPVPIVVMIVLIKKEQLFVRKDLSIGQSFLATLFMSFGACLFMGGFTAAPFLVGNEWLADSKITKTTHAVEEFSLVSDRSLPDEVHVYVYQDNVWITLEFDADKYDEIANTDSVRVVTREGYFGFDFLQSYSLVRYKGR